MLDVREVSDRSARRSVSAIAPVFGLSRITFAEYQAWAQAEGQLNVELSDAAVLDTRLAALSRDQPPPPDAVPGRVYRERMVGRGTTRLRG